MRERLIACFVLFAVFVVVLFGAIRAYSLVGMVKADEAAELDHSIVLMAALLAGQANDSEQARTSRLMGYLDRAEHLTFVNAAGEVSVAQSPTYDPEPSKYDVSRSMPVAGGGTLTLKRSGSVIDERIADAILPIIELTLVLIVIAMGVGYVLAARLSQPFRKLARIADDIGRGKFDTEVPKFAIREANVVGQSLQASATKLEQMVRAESEFASNASHQLRTPIAALHLSLEDVAAWAETPPKVAAEIQRSVHELDRLSDAVTSLLDMARSRDAMVGGPAVDLADLTADAAERWRPQVAVAGRQITAGSLDSCLVDIQAGAVNQILDVLIENSLKHGVGRIDLVATDEDGCVRLRVEDEGTERIGQEVFTRRVRGTNSDGEGIGLSLAAELAAHAGGELKIGGGPTTSFELIVPKR